ncbi:MAG: hypothetical protein R6X08_00355 [Desulfosalsimonadaceae bacterium]
MGFKQNLKQKIRIDSLAKRAELSVGPAGSGRKVDREAIRFLALTAGYEKDAGRGLEFYKRPLDSSAERILVLDNDLAIYHSTVADVLLRKNPSLREMVSISNMFKILNDKDVAVSKGTDSVAVLHRESLAGLDLSWSEADIYGLTKEGRDALPGENVSGVRETLELFAEILDLAPPPLPMSLPGILVLGELYSQQGQTVLFGPLVVYETGSNSLKYFDRRMDREELNRTQAYLDMAGGKEEAACEGADVFDLLARRILETSPQLA